MSGTRITMSGGDVFYVADSPDHVRAYISRYIEQSDLMRIGRRWISPQHVAMLTLEPFIPGVETPERLEAAADAE
jgi:hypothetical protein